MQYQAFHLNLKLKQLKATKRFFSTKLDVP